MGNLIWDQHDESDSESIHAVADTLKILHKSVENKEEIVKFLEAIAGVKPQTENYFFSSMYSSSEREPLCYMDYQRMISREWANPILLRNNWTVLESYGLSAAFTFDTATQNDGLHIIGPTMKTMATKFFHHICYGNNEHEGEIPRRGTVVGSKTAPQ